MLQSADTTASLAITPSRMISSILSFGPVIKQTENGEDFVSFCVLFTRCIYATYNGDESFSSLKNTGDRTSLCSGCCNIHVGRVLFFMAKKRNIKIMTAQATEWVRLSDGEVLL
jgi:hypothetical protein